MKPDTPDTPGLSDSPLRTPGLDETIDATPAPNLDETVDATPVFGRPVRPKPAEVADILPEIEGYDMLRVLGRGGMGVVYEAIQKKLERTVAVKLLPTMLSSAQPTLVKRFQDEAANAARLNHPNIIPVYDFGKCRDGYFYVMERLEGQPLDAVIKTIGEMDYSGAAATSMADVVGSSPSPGTQARETEDDSGFSSRTTGRDRQYYQHAAAWIADIADALDYAHQQKVVHRDIKPSNIFVCSDGRIILLDFGLVKVMGDESVTVTGALVGSLRYMSPEQVGGAKRAVVDHRTDIYSLGASLYEMLTFRPAFTGQDQADLFQKILHQDPHSPRKFISTVPPDLETICLKALEKQSSGRYESAKQMADDLHLFQRGLPIVARPVGPIGRTIRFVRRNRVATVITFALGLVVATTAAAAVIQRNAHHTRLAALVSEASSYMRLGQWRSAQSSLLEVLQVEPESFSGLVNLAITKKELYYASKEPSLLDEAAVLLDRALSVDAQRKEIWNLLGIVRRTQGDLDAAIEALQTALKLDDAYAPTWNNMGSVYALKGDLEESESSLKQGVLKGPDDVLAWHNLAAVQLALGKSDVVDSLSRALAIDRSSISGLLLKARVHLSLEGHVLPSEALRYAIAADVNRGEGHTDGRVMLILARAQLMNSLWEDVVLTCSRLVESGGDKIWGRLLEASARYELGDQDASKQIARELGSSAPAGPHCVVERGYLWFSDHTARQDLSTKLWGRLGGAPGDEGS
jgi:serine/threonine protein kinase/Tfp pilus assembly protein PilF